MKSSRSLVVSVAACSSAVILTLAFAAPSTSAQPAPLQPRTECPTIPWKPLEVAHEVIDIGPIQEDPKEAVNTYKSGGDNEISDEVMREELERIDLEEAVMANWRPGGR